MEKNHTVTSYGDGFIVTGSLAEVRLSAADTPQERSGMVRQEWENTHTHISYVYLHDM